MCQIVQLQCTLQSAHSTPDVLPVDRPLLLPPALEPITPLPSYERVARTVDHPLLLDHPLINHHGAIKRHHCLCPNSEGNGLCNPA